MDVVVVSDDEQPQPELAGVVAALPRQVRRKRFVYQDFDDAVFPAGKDSVGDDVEMLRWATREYQANKGLRLGDFRSPKMTAVGWIHVGQCVRHVQCHTGNGSYFQFIGQVVVDPPCYRLQVRNLKNALTRFRENDLRTVSPLASDAQTIGRKAGLALRQQA